jgi:hypothetical protein
MVHIQAQFDFNISSSNPRAAMRKNFRGSIPSSPVAGHPEEHAPQVRHRFRFPPSGSISITLSMKILFFLPPNLKISSDIVFSFG